MPIPCKLYNWVSDISVNSDYILVDDHDMTKHGEFTRGAFHKDSDWEPSDDWNTSDEWTIKQTNPEGHSHTRPVEKTSQ